MLLICDVGENSWESLGLQEDERGQFSRKFVHNGDWKSWYWIWILNILITWSEGLTHWERAWCWKILKAGGEGKDRRVNAWQHHWLGDYVFEQALCIGDGQGSLACCNPWCQKESDRIKWIHGTHHTYFGSQWNEIGKELSYPSNDNPHRFLMPPKIAHCFLRDSTRMAILSIIWVNIP